MEQTGNGASPSTREWVELYDAADAFRALAPWEWMDDSMLFAVRDPGGGDTGYCTVMGMLGQFRAFGVYLGPEGFALHDEIRRTSRKPDPELRFRQRCLMASFEDRRDQWPEDIKVLKSLGRSYRGRGAWPLFRERSPGLMPWFLTGEHARFLAEALRVGVEVGRRCKRNASPFRGTKGTLPLLAPKSDLPPEAWRWERVEAPPPLPAAGLASIPADEIRLKRFLQSSRRGEMTLEVDIAHAPMPTRDGVERPYFPRILLEVESRSGMVLSVALAAPSDSREKLLDAFLGGLETMRALPAEVRVVREEVATLLGPSLAALGVPLRHAKSLPAQNRARREMERMVCR